MSSNENVTALSRLQDLLKADSFDVESLASLLTDDKLREELTHDDVAWIALDTVCDFLQSFELELHSRGSEILGQLLRYLAQKANPREFLLALSDRIDRAKHDTAWALLLKPLAISINKSLVTRSADAVVEDAIFAAISHVTFMNRKFDETCDAGEVSDICCKTVITFLDEFFSEELLKQEKIGMLSVAACLTLAATPLCTVSPTNGYENPAWKLALQQLGSVICKFVNPYSIFVDLTDISHRSDQFLGNYFANNGNGRWGHLQSGYACLLAANDGDFFLPQILEPRFRFFLCSNVISSLLTEITLSPNPDMDMVASTFATSLACRLVSNLLTSIPPDTFNAECISSVPSFTLLVRRLFMNLTGAQSSFVVDTESAGRIVKILDEFLAKSDFSGKWQMIWMWINQVPADSHPAGPVRAVAIDKFRQLVALSLKSSPAMLSEKLAKMLPMILTLSIARDNVSEGKPGLLRVDAALAVLNLLHYVFLVSADARLIDDTSRKTIGAWLEYELRPSVAATRTFLHGASEGLPKEPSSVATTNPWTCFSGQLLSRIDMVEFTLARVEQINESYKSKSK